MASRTKTKCCISSSRLNPSVPHGWGHSRKGTRQAIAEAHAGASINDIIRDDQIDLLSGTSVLNGQNVRVKAWKAERSQKRA